MWTTENRPRYNRDKLRYPSDLTDAEWACIEASVPPAKHGGRQREADVRELLNGVMYVLSTGCQWRYIPKDLPPRSTLHDYFQRWHDDGTLSRIHHKLYVECRERIGRKASPTACVIDSQSVKSAEKGGRSEPHGYDAGKKIKGKSGIFLSIRQACYYMRSFIQPTSRTVMAGYWSCPACLAFFRSSGRCSPTLVTKGRNSRKERRKSGRISPSRSSGARMPRKGLNSCHGVGWWNAPSPGSTAAAVWPTTSRTAPVTRWHF